MFGFTRQPDEDNYCDELTVDKSSNKQTNGRMDSNEANTSRN